MTDTNSYLLSDARKALQEHRLSSALSSLQGMATLLKAWNETEELEAMTTAYRTLLTYFSQGINDPERLQLYNKFISRAYELSDALERLMELKNDTSFYTTSLRTLENIKGHNLTVSSFLNAETDYKDLFQAIWLSPALKPEDESALLEFLADGHQNVHHQCLVLSALTLSAIKFFDAAKTHILIQYATSANTLLRTRALTGLLFVTFFFADRIALYPRLHAQLLLLTDDTHFVHEIELIQAQLFLSLETKRIERNLQEEIIPRMMKRMEHLKLDRSLGIDELKEKLAEADLNPEWEADGKPSKLGQYMQEFVELQRRGADLYMGTFKMLKQRVPFFREISNWFYPFSMYHPGIPAVSRQNKTLNLLLQSNGLCDSDKYSFCLIADQLKHNLSEEALQGLVAGKGMDVNVLPESSNATDFKECLRSYIQGFYRFSNLYTYNTQFPNPFQQDVFIANYRPFDQLLKNRNWVNRMADFTFKDKSYKIALSLYESIPTEERDASIWQKIGFCYEQNHDIEQAVVPYTWANDLKPSDTWTLRRLATCQRLQGHYEKALLHYNQLAQIYPEDPNIAFRQGECHLHLSQYDEAFKGFFKADYLDENSGKTMRALAWCSLLTQKFEQAERYYNKILNQSPSKTDFLNAGHTAWLRGNLPQAIQRYVKALPKENPERFLQEDHQLLLDNGRTEDDLHIMIDAVLSAALADQA